MATELDYKTSLFIVLAIRGLHPFNPDAGILCGGYQSPIYPQPTQLVQPTIDPDIIFAQGDMASIYVMKTEPDFYEGLGKWNPSINYRNPGHLLGLYDTYNRMGYGMAVLEATKEGSTSDPNVSIVNPITTTIPLLDSSYLPNEFNLDLIYTIGFSERPHLYILGMVDSNGNMIIEPRRGAEFTFTDRYIPATILPETVAAGFRAIFQNFLTDSYLFQRQRFQDIINELATFAQTNIGGENTILLSVEDLGKGDVLRTTDWPTLPLQDTFTGPNGLDGNYLAFNFGPSFIHPVIGPDALRTFYSNFTTMTTEDALNTLSGESDFHFGPTHPGGDNPNKLEYRTLTETNCVINLVPIQTYGITFGNHYEYDFTNWFASALDSPETYVSWLICDVIITSNIAQEVTIAGAATAERAASDPEVVKPIFPGSPTSSDESILTIRNFAIATSTTRDFTWNRSWWDLPNSDVQTLDEEERVTNSTKFVDTFVDNSEDPIAYGITLQPTPYVLSDNFEINKTLQFNGTGETIRARIIIQSQSVSWDNFVNAGDDLSINITVAGKTFNVVHSSLIPGSP